MFVAIVTEAEVEEGLLKAEDSIARQAIWLRRNIEDIDRQESSYALSRYTGERMRTNMYYKVYEPRNQCMRVKGCPRLGFAFSTGVV
ncbi:hypothetical protein DPMN_164047 [Dreissena polymorpha]|uniref:Uncharacterized protein n=1 Tax=Dreissena polymorpha TaxID=45954 RepID=A0A9D4EX01_DREPO|nr:hypothetical protein DPMN_164047 [Dreissena polymorpha]